MGIYLPNMDMPHKGQMIVIFPDGICYVCFNGRRERLTQTKAFHVSPHGRLIDADYADEYAYDELELANNYLTGWEAARAMQKIYQAAPTVIPADKDGGT